MKKIYHDAVNTKAIPAVKEVWESKIKQSKKNKHISYSQLSTYDRCPKQWYLTYVKKLIPYEGSIHASFGTAFHETLQEWLQVLYHGKVKDAMAMDVDALLYENMIKAYKSTKAQNGHEHFATAEDLRMFWLDGKHIFEFIKKKRRAYFNTKGVHLAGVETLLYQELRPGVMFKGFIDLVFYDARVDRWKIVDIKTSTRGWSALDKKDLNKTQQLILYKKFLAKQFNIDIDKIDVEYFVVKRRVPVEADFAAMQRRVQEFSPASGKGNTNKVLKIMQNFVTKAVDHLGNYIEEDHKANPTKDNCKWCNVKKMRLCPEAVL